MPASAYGTGNPDLQSYGFCLFFFNDTATTEIYTLSLHDALPIWLHAYLGRERLGRSCDRGDEHLRRVGLERGDRLRVVGDLGQVPRAVVGVTAALGSGLVHLVRGLAALIADQAEPGAAKRLQLAEHRGVGGEQRGMRERAIILVGEDDDAEVRVRPHEALVRRIGRVERALDRGEGLLEAAPAGAGALGDLREHVGQVAGVIARARAGGVGGVGDEGSGDRRAEQLQRAVLAEVAAAP